MKKSLTLTTLLLTAACGSSSGGSSGTAAALVGIDMSGTYQMTGVECLDSSYQVVASSGILNGMQVTTVISRNSSTTTAQLGLCTVVISGQVAFTSSNFYSATGRRVTSATNGSCSIGMVIGGGISPSSDVATASTGQQAADAIDSFYAYDQSTKTLAILNNTLTAGSGSTCFNVYQKQ